VTANENRRHRRLHICLESAEFLSFLRRHTAGLERKLTIDRLPAARESQAAYIKPPIIARADGVASAHQFRDDPRTGPRL
jgi:hypothetical protein